MKTLETFQFAHKCFLVFVTFQMENENENENSLAGKFKQTK